jgi:hypothetical protein
MNTIKRIAATLLATILLAVNGASATFTGQLLAYQGGYVFFTTGDGFRVAPNIAILDDATRKPTSMRPAPRLYARANFDDKGTVTELDLSQSALPVEPLPDNVRQFAVQLSPQVPNPELSGSAANAISNIATAGRTFSGKPVLVVITVQVPPSTPPTAEIYLTTDTTGWNAQAIQLDRIDALHFRVTRKIASGTVMRYLYTRGSFQSEERAENGLDRTPREVVIGDADVRAINDIVYNWADQSTGGVTSQPLAIPTPFNPAPFPNLPSGAPTPHPR